MITLTRIDGREITINADEIETIDSSYDTAINLKSGKCITVRENHQEIIKKVIEYRQECFKKLINLDNINN